MSVSLNCCSEHIRCPSCPALADSCRAAGVFMAGRSESSQLKAKKSFQMKRQAPCCELFWEVCLLGTVQGWLDRAGTNAHVCKHTHSVSPQSQCSQSVCKINREGRSTCAILRKQRIGRTWAPAPRTDG